VPKNKIHVPKIDLNQIIEKVRMSPSNKKRKKNQSMMVSINMSRAGKRSSVISSKNTVIGKNNEMKGRS
jgi:hypothetical protein